MVPRLLLSIAVFAFLSLEGCFHNGPQHAFVDSVPPSAAHTTKVLAVYEPWFGHPQHIDVGYSSQDPVTIKKQIEQAKRESISGFVVDWYGDREPFIDKSYALIQSIAAETNFNVAMMYDETDQDTAEATDDALTAFDDFREKYLGSGARGSKAYLTYQGRPVIFIFPKGRQTDWNRVRAEINKWNPSPLLIYEYGSSPYASAFDGFYAWINPGKKGWSADGANWGEDYLQDFYQTMRTKYPDKIAIGAAWPGFDDRNASWGLKRYISRRCGATLKDTMSIASENPEPFLVIATWNDYEEGTAIERAAKCDSAERASTASK